MRKLKGKMVEILRGLTATVNTVGIMFLPNGKHFFISVFVSNSKEDADVNEKIIADIARVAWNCFVLKPH